MALLGSNKWLMLYVFLGGQFFFPTVGNYQPLSTPLCSPIQLECLTDPSKCRKTLKNNEGSDELVIPGLCCVLFWISSCRLINPTTWLRQIQIPASIVIWLQFEQKIFIPSVCMFLAFPLSLPFVFLCVTAFQQLFELVVWGHQLLWKSPISHNERYICLLILLYSHSCITVYVLGAV